MTRHRTDEALLRFARHQTPEDEVPSIDAHLIECEACRERAWQLAEGRERGARLIQELTSVSREETLASGLGSSHRLRWARAVAVAAVLGTVLLLSRPASTDLLISMRAPAGVVLRPVERLMVTIAGLHPRSRQPFIDHYALVLDAQGRIPDLRVPVGTCAVSVVRDDPRGGAKRLLVALKDLRRGRNVVRLVDENNRSVNPSVGLTGTAATNGAIRGVLDGASLNLFDNVEVRAGDRVFFRERFEQPDGTSSIPGMETQWQGMGGFVSRVHGLPSSQGGAWVNLAYPNSNRADRIPLRPDDIPPGELLIIEARVLVTDPRSGIEIALSKPYKNADVMAQDTPMLVRFELGKITAHNRPDLMSFEPLRWYHVRIECDLTTHTYNVAIDGALVVTGITMAESNRAGVGYDFDGVELGGNWFDNRQ